ncbi:hypothetical protein [Thiorhodococcus mannitoliphagus]|nr:hypothetical protein [Thiorhodococcus mannitoliphagus]
MLRETLEMYLDEPAEMLDLAPGALPVRLAAVQVGDQTLTGPSPFADDNHVGDHFYQGGDGSISPGLTEAQCALVDPWTLSGYVVRHWRRLYRSTAPTQYHLTSETALDHVRSRARKQDIWREHFYGLLLDPAGYHQGRISAVVSEHRRLADAIRRAERVAGQLEIRCLVAQLEGAISIR